MRALTRGCSMPGAGMTGPGPRPGILVVPELSWKSRSRSTSGHERPDQRRIQAGGFRQGEWPCVAFASQPGVRQVLEIAGVCLNRYTTGIRPCYGENTPFPWCEGVGGARPAQGSAPGRRQGTTGTTVRRVWKNNGSAVKTEPHGETSAIGNKKPRNIKWLARAALEREGEVRGYRVRIPDMGQFPAYMHKEAALAARARV